MRGVGAGYVGILSVELHFPEAGSLKGKRKYVKSAKAQLQNRFGASVAEVDHHELWQRARLTVAGVDTSPDLRHAVVFVSILGSEKKRAASLRGLEAAHGVLQARLARELR